MTTKKFKFPEQGSNFPKKRIIELIEIFGLRVDYDQWDVTEKGWIRIESECTDLKPIILHKDHLEISVHQEELYLTDLFRKYLIQIGEIEFKKKYRELMGI